MYVCLARSRVPPRFFQRKYVGWLAKGSLASDPFSTSGLVVMRLVGKDASLEGYPISFRNMLG